MARFNFLADIDLRTGIIVGLVLAAPVVSPVPLSATRLIVKTAISTGLGL